MTQAGPEGERPPPPSFAGALSRELHIVNRKGLHARATAKFVQCVDRFHADVKVTRCGETVGGDSIMGILTLGAGPGSTITVSASGAKLERRWMRWRLASPAGSAKTSEARRLLGHAARGRRRLNKTGRFEKYLPFLRNIG